jgi:hypothetical protein
MMIPIIFATAASEEVWKWVEHCAVALGVVATAIAIKKSQKKERRKIEPDPLRVRKFEPKALDSDCRARHAAALERIEAIDQENTEEHKRLYDQIDAVEKRAEDKLNLSLAAVNETVRRLPGEVIKLLRDTGQLKQHHDSD